MVVVEQESICAICGKSFFPVKRKQYTCGARECVNKWGKLKAIQKWQKLAAIPEPTISLPLKISFAAGSDLARRQGVWTDGTSFEQKGDEARALKMSYGRYVAKRQLEYEKENGIGLYANNAFKEAQSES